MVADGLVARHYEVKGQVQGVGFRDFTRRTATTLGLTGTVRNTASGTVEVDARGTPADLDQLEKALREGPAGARVIDLARTDLPGSTPSDGFHIIR